MLAFDLLERLAEALEIFRRDADAGIAHRDLQPALSRSAHTHVAAARRELDAVGQQVDQHLLDRALVGEDRARLRRDRDLGAATPARSAGWLHETHAGFARLPSRSKISSDSSNLPASIFDMSRMPLMSSSRCAAAFVDQAANIRDSAALPTGPNISCVITSEKPMIAFSGVRSSWLILARKLDLARLALFGQIARLDQRAVRGSCAR